MGAREWAEEMLADSPDALFMDGFDDAIIGVTTDQAGRISVVVYDEGLIIQGLVEEGLDETEAWDHYGFNIQGTYVGEYTPVIIRRYEET